MSDVPERGKPETRMKVLSDFFWGGFESGRSFKRIFNRSSRFGISGRSKILSLRLFATVLERGCERRILRVSARWYGSFFRIAAACPMQCREVAMSIVHFRAKSERSLKRQDGTFGLSTAGHRDTEIKVGHRQPVKQADCAQGGIRGFLVKSFTAINR